MLLEDLSLRMPGLEIRVSRNPKFEKKQKKCCFYAYYSSRQCFDHTNAF
jgi:hypothetical protein